MKRATSRVLSAVSLASRYLSPTLQNGMKWLTRFNNRTEEVHNRSCRKIRYSFTTHTFQLPRHFRHAGYETVRYVEIKWIDSETRQRRNIGRDTLRPVTVLLFPAASATEVSKVRLLAAKYARENRCAVSRNLPWYADSSNRICKTCTRT